MEKRLNQQEPKEKTLDEATVLLEAVSHLSPTEDKGRRAKVKVLAQKMFTELRNSTISGKQGPKQAGDCRTALYPK